MLSFMKDHRQPTNRLRSYAKITLDVRHSVFMPMDRGHLAKRENTSRIEAAVTG